MAKTPADDLKDQFKGASSVDIEVSDFSVVGWRYICEAIPETARIRIIVGMFKDRESIEDNLQIGFADLKELKDLSSRIHWRLCKIVKASNLHHKRYISKGSFGRVQIITGSGNLSKNALSGKQKNDWHPVQISRTRKNILQGFEYDWKNSTKNISESAQEAIMAKIGEKEKTWQPPDRNFWNPAIRRRRFSEAEMGE